MEFQADLNLLVGEVCWGIAAGAGTGSVLAMHFGQKIRRRVPIRNRHLSRDLRNYDGLFGLFIECAWRLDSDAEVLCGWRQSGQKRGPLGIGLHRILNQRVERVDSSLPGLDVALNFQNSVVLRVFCDQTERDADNYSLFVPKWCYVIGPKSKLKRHARTEKAR